LAAAPEVPEMNLHPDVGRSQRIQIIGEANQLSLCYTCELPWLDNETDKSCIPTGTYTCAPHNSPDHPNTWELLDVPGRDAVLIHNGNAAEEDSKGCILVGDRFGVIDGFPAVLNSVATLNILRGKFPPNFTLTIS
jgi:hypothetical protein